MEVDENENVVNENVVNESYEERRFQDTKKKSPKYYKFDNNGNIILDDKNSGMSKPSSKIVYDQITREYQPEGSYDPIKLLSNIPFSLFFDTGNKQFYTLNKGRIIDNEVVKDFSEMLKTEVDAFNNEYLNTPGLIANLNPLEVDQLKEKIKERTDYIMALETNIAAAAAAAALEEVNPITNNFFMVMKKFLPLAVPLQNNEESNTIRIYYDENRGLYYAVAPLFKTGKTGKKGLLTAELTNKQVEQIRDLTQKDFLEKQQRLLQEQSEQSEQERISKYKRSTTLPVNNNDNDDNDDDNSPKRTRQEVLSADAISDTEEDANSDTEKDMHLADAISDTEEGKPLAAQRPPPIYEIKTNIEHMKSRMHTIFPEINGYNEEKFQEYDNALKEFNNLTPDLLLKIVRFKKFEEIVKQICVDFRDQTILMDHINKEFPEAPIPAAPIPAALMQNVEQYDDDSSNNQKKMKIGAIKASVPEMEGIETPADQEQKKKEVMDEQLNVNFMLYNENKSPDIDCGEGCQIITLQNNDGSMRTYDLGVLEQDNKKLITEIIYELKREKKNILKNYREFKKKNASLLSRVGGPLGEGPPGGPGGQEDGPPGGPEGPVPNPNYNKITSFISDYYSKKIQFLSEEQRKVYEMKFMVYSPEEQSLIYAIAANFSAFKFTDDISSLISIEEIQVPLENLIQDIIKKMPPIKLNDKEKNKIKDLLQYSMQMLNIEKFNKQDTDLIDNTILLKEFNFTEDKFDKKIDVNKFYNILETYISGVPFYEVDLGQAKGVSFIPKKGLKISGDITPVRRQNSLNSSGPSPTGVQTVWGAPIKGSKTDADAKYPKYDLSDLLVSTGSTRIEGGQKGGQNFPFSKTYLTLEQIRKLKEAFGNATDVQVRYLIIKLILQILLYADSMHDFYKNLSKILIQAVTDAFNFLYSVYNNKVASPSSYLMRKNFEDLPGIGPDIREMLQNYKDNAGDEWGGYESVIAYRFKQDPGLSEMTILKWIYINPNNLNDKKNFFSQEDLIKLGQEEYIFRSPSSAPGDSNDTDSTFKSQDDDGQWWSYFVLMNIDGSPVKPVLEVNDLENMRAYTDNPIPKDVLAVLFGLVDTDAQGSGFNFDCITITKDQELAMKNALENINNFYIPGLADPSTTSRFVEYIKLENNRPSYSIIPDNEQIKMNAANTNIDLALPPNNPVNHPNSLMALSMQTFLDLYANQDVNLRVQITKFTPIISPTATDYSGITITAAKPGTVPGPTNNYNLVLKDTSIENIKKLVEIIFESGYNFNLKQLNADTLIGAGALNLDNESHRRLIKLSVMYYNNMEDKYKTNENGTMNKNVFISCVLMWKAFGDYWEITYVYGLDYLNPDDQKKYFITSTDKNVALMMMWLGVNGIIAKTSVHLPTNFVATENTIDTSEEISLISDNVNFIKKQMGEGMLSNIFPKEKDTLYNIKIARDNIIELSRRADLINQPMIAPVAMQPQPPQPAIQPAMQPIDDNDADDDADDAEDNAFRKIIDANARSAFDIQKNIIINENCKNAVKFVIDNYLTVPVAMDADAPPQNPNVFNTVTSKDAAKAAWITKITANVTEITQKMQDARNSQNDAVDVANDAFDLNQKIKMVRSELNNKIPSLSQDFFNNLIILTQNEINFIQQSKVVLNGRNTEINVEIASLNPDEDEKLITKLEKEKNINLTEIIDLDKKLGKAREINNDATQNKLIPQRKDALKDILINQLKANEVVKKINNLNGSRFLVWKLEDEINRLNAMLEELGPPAVAPTEPPVGINKNSEIYKQLIKDAFENPGAVTMDNIIKLFDKIFNASRVIYDISAFKNIYTLDNIIKPEVMNTDENPFKDINILLNEISRQPVVAAADPAADPDAAMVIAPPKITDFVRTTYSGLKQLEMSLNFNPVIMEKLPSIALQDIKKLCESFSDTYYTDMQKKILDEIKSDNSIVSSRNRVKYELNHTNFLNRFNFLKTQIEWAMKVIEQEYVTPIENFQTDMKIIGGNCLGKLRKFHEFLSGKYDVLYKENEIINQKTNEINELSKTLEDFLKGIIADPVILNKLLTDIKKRIKIYYDNNPHARGGNKYKVIPFNYPSRDAFKKMKASYPNYEFNDGPDLKENFVDAIDKLLNFGGPLNIPAMYALLKDFSLIKVQSKEMVLNKILNFLDAIDIKEDVTKFIANQNPDAAAAAAAISELDLDEKISKAYREIEDLNDAEIAEAFDKSNSNEKIKDLIKKIKDYKKDAQKKIAQKTENKSMLDKAIALGNKLTKKLLGAVDTDNKRDANAISKKQLKEVQGILTQLYKTASAFNKRTPGTIVAICNAASKKTQEIVDDYENIFKGEEDNFIKSMPVHMSAEFNFETGLYGGSKSKSYTRKLKHVKPKKKKYTHSIKSKIVNRLTKKYKIKQLAKKKRNSRRK